MIDDEQDLVESFVWLLEEHWDITKAYSPKYFINLLESIDTFDVVILDLVFAFTPGNQPSQDVTQNFPISSGRQFLIWMQNGHPQIPVVIHSALYPSLTKDMEDLQEQFKHLLFIGKPVDVDGSHFREKIEAYAKSYLAPKIQFI